MNIDKIIENLKFTGCSPNLLRNAIESAIKPTLGEVAYMSYWNTSNYSRLTGKEKEKWERVAKTVINQHLIEAFPHG